MAPRLAVSRLEMTTFAAIDPAYFICDENQLAYLKDRAQPGWLDTLRSSFSGASEGGFSAPRFDSSQYGNTDRQGRNTFSREFASQLMPLAFEVEAPPENRDGRFEWRVSTVRLGPTGTLSLRATADLDVRKARHISVSTVVDSYHQFQVALAQRIPLVMSSFFELWNQRLPQYAVESLDPTSLMDRLHRYELVDFDYVCIDSEQMLMKDLYTRGDAGLVRHLAGLTRMSPVMGSYDETSARRISQFDIGSRSDEMWIINEERLVRHHPERGKNIYVDAFFEDVRLGVEILTQQETALHYIQGWASRSRHSLRNRLLSEVDDAGAAAEVREALDEILAASDLVSEPISLEKHVHHSFFRTLLGRVIDVTGVSAQRREAREMFHELNALIDSTAVHRMSAASVKLQSADLEVAESARKMTFGTYILTGAVILLMIVQIYIAITESSSDEGPTNGDSTTTTTTVEPD